MARAVLMEVPISDTGLKVTVSVLTNGSIYQALRQKKNRKRSWAEIERVMERYYDLMAADLQRLVAEEYERERRRPNVSTGRLEGATLDARNRTKTRDGFGIGVPSYLDKSQAKYWRQIESGTRVHIGRHLYGVFGATLAGGYGKGKAWPSWRNARYGPDWSFVGDGFGGGFTPKKALSGGARREHFRGPRQVGGGHGEGGYSRNTRMIIDRPIEAQGGYKEAFRRFRRSNRAFLLFRKAVIEELGLRSDQVGRSYESILNNVF